MTRIPMLSGAWTAATATAALLLAAAPALAFDPAVAACVTACSTEARACEDAIRADTAACLDESGCSPLLEAAKTACEADPESEECAAARDAARACVGPCRDDDKDGREGCRAARVTCLGDECGLSDAEVGCGRFRPARRAGGRS